MSCIILLVDLRDKRTILEERKVGWRKGMTAKEAIRIAFSQEESNQVAADLEKDVPELTVSWTSLETEEHTEVGGVGTLEWMIDNNSVLVVTYENQNTTKQQIRESSEWMLNVYERATASL